MEKTILTRLMTSLVTALFATLFFFPGDTKAKVSREGLILHYSFDKTRSKGKISQIYLETKTMVSSKVNKKLLKEKSRKVWSLAAHPRTIFLLGTITTKRLTLKPSH